MNKKDYKEVTQFQEVQIWNAIQAVFNKAMPEGTESPKGWMRGLVEKELDIHDERLDHLMSIVFGILSDMLRDPDKITEKVKKVKLLVRVEVFEHRETKEKYLEKVYMR